VRGGEGALAPSCHAPQDHDQTRGDFQFFCRQVDLQKERKTCHVLVASQLDKKKEGNWKYIYDNRIYRKYLFRNQLSIFVLLVSQNQK